MLELVSPAGSPEGVVAAVQNGADAVYLGFKEHNACIKAQNFTYQELGRALEYCRVRGVKAYLMLNTLAYDGELLAISEYARQACRLGIDAIIVQDFGVMRAVRKTVPDVPVYADSKMSIHNLEGVKMAAAMGMQRVILSHELSRRKLAYICRNAPIEVEVIVHGEICVSYSGQCYLSSAKGKGSNNRGMCTQLCRQGYNAVGYAVKYPLSIRDACLARYMTDLSLIGVTAARIEGMSKRPEHSAIVTGIYAKAIHKNKAPSQEEIRTLHRNLSKHGLTDGYYTDRLGSEMFGMREEPEKKESVIFSSARKNYLNGEFQRVPVRFVGTISKGKRVKLAGADDRKNTAVVYGPMPAPAFHKDLNEASMQTQLHKTSGTPFYCVGVRSKVDSDLSLPISAFNEMRRDVLAEILELRKPAPVRAEGEYAPGEIIFGYDEPQALTVFLTRERQLTLELAKLSPDIIYIPITEINFESPIITALLETEDTNLAISLPHIIHDNERKRLSDMMLRAVRHGVTDVLVGNLGHIQFAKSNGMVVRGDYSFNAYNSETIAVLRDLGLKSTALSFELSLNEIRELSKPIDTELIVYGRLPLMLTENCIIRSSSGACTCDSNPSLVDKDGSHLPILPEYGCRNVLLSPKKVFLADKRKAMASVGAWAKRLNFTTENASECIAVTKRFMGLSGYTPTGYTRGLYYRES